MDLITNKTDEVETENDELKVKDEHADLKENELDDHESTEESVEIDEESIMDYPELFNFLKKEATNYSGKKYDVDFYDEDSKQLETVIEKAIFYDRYIFNGYFEVTDARYELAKSIDDDEDFGSERSLGKNRRFEFRSNMISKACGNIDKAMVRLQKRATKEPYFWVLASYKGNKR